MAFILIGIQPVSAPNGYLKSSLSRLDYSGELGTDFGTAGRWWADRVAAARRESGRGVDWDRAGS
jgi:hypothetical protein